MEVTPELIKQYKGWLGQYVAPDTVRSYSSTVQTYCMGMSSDELNDKVWFRSFQGQLREKGSTLNTVSRHTFAMKNFLRFLCEECGISVFDTKVIRCKHPPMGNPTFLTRAEITQLREVPIKTEGDLRVRTLFEFLLDTGCRISEVVALDYKDLDFVMGEAEVLGKGGVKRVVYFNGSKPWLERYYKERTHWAAHLFLGQYGRRWNRASASTAVVKFGRKSSVVQRVHPHLLRHTFGTYCIQAGIDPKTVQMMMGHQDLQTTLKYYVGVNKDSMRRAHAELSLYTNA